MFDDTLICDLQNAGKIKLGTLRQWLWWRKNSPDHVADGQAVEDVRHEPEKTSRDGHRWGFEHDAYPGVRVFCRGVAAPAEEPGQLATSDRADFAITVRPHT